MKNVRLTPTGRPALDPYYPHVVTMGAMEATLKASTWQDIRHGLGGHNGAAIQCRIDYMRKAVNVGLVHLVAINRAQDTIRNLEEQLLDV